MLYEDLLAIPAHAKHQNQTLRSQDEERIFLTKILINKVGVSEGIISCPCTPSYTQWGAQFPQQSL